MQPPMNMPANGAEDQILALNIGGTHTIMTSLKVLRQVPESKLCAFFDNINDL